MKHLVPRQSQNGKQEWLSALFTLLVLTGIYSSMDHFSSFAKSESSDTPKSNSWEISSVAPPYWNHTMGYGFRSIAWDTYTSSGNQNMDMVQVHPSGLTSTSHKGIRVSFYKDTPINEIDQSLIPGSARAYSRLPHGIAVIQWDLDSASAKTIFSTLHSD